MRLMVRTKYNVEVLFSYFNGKAWLRISGSAYSTKEDFIIVKDVMVKIFKEHDPDILNI